MIDLDNGLMGREMSQLRERAERAEAESLAAHAGLKLAQADLKARLAKLQAKFDGMAHGYRQDLKRLEEARQVLKLVKTPYADVWVWQGDGMDEPKSLGCPVVMSADTLRAIINERDAARDALAKEEGNEPV